MRSSCDAVAMKRLRAVVELGELALHVVERARELAELVLGADSKRGEKSPAATRRAACSMRLMRPASARPAR